MKDNVAKNSLRVGMVVRDANNIVTYISTLLILIIG